MSKEEFLKIQTCVLKVNIHCDGCKNKVKKILQKIDGVYKTNIDSELGKVTVCGNVDPETLIKKLAKSGKRAEIWGAQKANKNKQNQLNNQLKNLQIDSGKKGSGNNKGQQHQQQPKSGVQIGGQGMNPMQLQQLKALQDQLRDLKMMPPMPLGKDQNQKAVKFSMPEEEDLSDDDYHDYDDDEEDDDFEDDYEDEFDDEMDDAPLDLNKMKPMIGNPNGMPNMMMMMNGLGAGANNGVGNGKKGGGGVGNIPVQMNLGGGGGNDGKNGGKKGGNGGGAAQKGGKNGGGQPQDGKNGGVSGGGGQNKNGNNGNPNINGKGNKKGEGMNGGVKGMPNMMMAMNAAAGGGGKVGPPAGGMPIGQMGQMMGQMGQMGNVSAVQGLPAAPAANGAGYSQGAAPEMMGAGNPHYQQQLAAMMMNQQRANGNERFQPMMYARPPPAVNYWPTQPYYSYPYHAPPPGEYYTDADINESTSSCSVM